MLADVEVVSLHSFLSVFDGPGNQGMLNRLTFFHSQAAHDPGDSLGSENTKQIIFQRKIKARGSRVSLPAGPSAKLIVDSAGFVALRPENMQS